MPRGSDVKEKAGKTQGSPRVQAESPPPLIEISDSEDDNTVKEAREESQKITSTKEQDNKKKNDMARATFQVAISDGIRLSMTNVSRKVDSEGKDTAKNTDTKVKTNKNDKTDNKHTNNER